MAHRVKTLKSEGVIPAFCRSHPFRIIQHKEHDMKKHLAIFLTAFALFASSANALVFDFSFDGDDNGPPSVVGTVTGKIYGLVDNLSGQVATSIILTSFPAGLGGALSTTELLDFNNQVFHSFNVSGGQITGGGFAAQNTGGEGDTIIFGSAAAFTVQGVPYNNFLSLDNGGTITGNSDGGFPGTTFTPAVVPDAVPDAGSTFALLAGALIGLAAIRRKVLAK